MEAVEEILGPWPAEKQESAFSALKDEEHALALDSEVFTQLRKRVGGAGAGMALHIQMQGLAPTDEIERMIVLHLKAMHGLTLRATRRSHRTERIDHYRDYINAANKSSRTFTTLLEALNRHRGKSSEQKVTVEHVHVHEGGQAVVGNVERPREGGHRKKSVGPPHG